MDILIQLREIPATKRVRGKSGVFYDCDGNGLVRTDDAGHADIVAQLTKPADEVFVVVPPAEVPQRVTAFQLRWSLDQAGHRGTPAFALDKKSAMAWLFSADANRNGEMVAGIMAHFGIDDAAMDALFIEAAGVEA